MAKQFDKAVFIDVENQSISEVEVPKEERLQALYEILNCSVVEKLTIGGNNDLIIDEEGLFKQDNKSFAIGGAMFVGNALIMGYNDDGDWCDHNIDIPRLSEVILFPDEDETREIFEKSQDDQDDNIVVD